MHRRTLALVSLIVFALAISSTPAEDMTRTPEALVATYDSLADALLGTKQAEWNLVHSILGTAYGHAETTFQQAKAKLAKGESARKEIEALAALVAQIGNEGDASVAAVRKRLVQGGHHHHSSDEQQGKYDEGFVIVTREAKKSFLDAAGRIGRMAGSADAAKLENEWKQVVATFRSLPQKPA